MSIVTSESASSRLATVSLNSSSELTSMFGDQPLTSAVKSPGKASTSPAMHASRPRRRT